MRNALVFAVLLLAGCRNVYIEKPNVEIVAPMKLDQATITVDGRQTMPIATPDPLPGMLAELFGHKQTVFAGFAQIPNGTHTLRIEKQGCAPIERTVDVGDHTVVQLCAADVRPVKSPHP